MRSPAPTCPPRRTGWPGCASRCDAMLAGMAGLRREIRGEVVITLRMFLSCRESQENPVALGTGWVCLRHIWEGDASLREDSLRALGDAYGRE